MVSPGRYSPDLMTAPIWCSGCKALLINALQRSPVRVRLGSHPRDVGLPSNFPSRNGSFGLGNTKDHRIGGTPCTPISPIQVPFTCYMVVYRGVRQAPSEQPPGRGGDVGARQPDIFEQVVRQLL